MRKSRPLFTLSNRCPYGDGHKKTECGNNPEWRARLEALKPPKRAKKGSIEKAMLVKLTRQEHDGIKKAAKKTGLTRVAWVRQQIEKGLHT